MSDRGHLSPVELSRRALCVIVSVPALWQLALLLTAIVGRLAYPYDLEWMEGGLLDHAARISEGNGIYVPPSVEFVPYLYTPLYAGVLAVLGEIVGISYSLGRAISVAALTVALAAIAASAQAPRSRWRLFPALCGVLGVGLVASAYPWVEGWYDIVRGDTLFIAMVVVAFYLLSRWIRLDGRRAHVRIAIVALLLSLSFFCKQHGVLFAAAGGLNLLLWRRWRLVPTYVVVCAIVGLGGSWLLQRVTDGWYWTYIYEIFGAHDFNWPRFRGAFGHMLGRSEVATATIGVAIVTAGLRVASGKKLPPAVPRALFWLAPWATAVAVGALGWAHQWAHFNAYIPSIFLGAALAATSLHAIGELAVALFPRRGAILALLLPAALAVQLVMMRWSPKPFVPSKTDVEAGNRLIERLRAIEGELFVPYHPWYGRLAGKETHAHRMGLMDVQFGNRLPVDGLADAFQRQRFAAVLVDNRPIGFALRRIQGRYRPGTLIPWSERPRLFTGAKVFPKALWIPIGPPPPPPLGARVLFEFEDGYRGWTSTGTAWGSGPRRASRDRGKQRAYEVSGEFYARSSSGGDKSTGTLESPAFLLDGLRLTARIGGGKSERLVVELVVDGLVIATATGAGSEVLELVSWNVSAHRGKRATIVLRDNDTGKRGHLSADAFWIWDK